MDTWITGGFNAEGGKKMALKRSKAKRGQRRCGCKTCNPSDGRWIEREIERLSEAEQERQRVGVHRRATCTAVHCGAQPPPCSLLTIRVHAPKRPPQQPSCTISGSLPESPVVHPAPGEEARGCFILFFGGVIYGSTMLETADPRLPALMLLQTEGVVDSRSPWIM